MYVAQRPSLLMWETPISTPIGLAGFGQETPAPTACPDPCPQYVEPEPTLGERLVMTALGFGIMVLAGYVGAKWALKART